MEITFFADILLPLPLPGTFTYRVPRDQVKQVEYGKRVVVQFGKQKLYSGIILNVHQEAPKNYEAKYILNVLDAQPIIGKAQEVFWQWLSNYYLCTLGEVMQAAIPSGLLISSETKVSLHPNYNGQGAELSDKEFLIYEALQSSDVLGLNEISAISDHKSVYALINSMQEKGVIIKQEELKKRYTPKKVSLVKLSKAYEEEEKLKSCFDDLSKAPSQLKMLTGFLQLSNFFNDGNQFVKKIKLQKKVGESGSVTKQLIKKGILIEEVFEESRIDEYKKQQKAIHQLADFQNEALKEIKAVFSQKEVCLLHGITSSGKTEIYLHLIKEQIELGNQVLFLIPEIALTTQLIARVKTFFGDAVGVFHSKFNQNEKIEVWLDLLNEQQRFKVIIGARSALFMPFKKLGLIIIDEEHESTFKQYDPSPRYHARDAAIVLAQQTNAKVLLGTATPSLESLYNAEIGKYGYVKILQRFNKMQLPEIWIADLSKERKKRTMKGFFSSLLIEEMEKVLGKKKQIILFKNRRGYSPYIQCQACGFTFDCVKCDITLTYHKHINLIKCHYCGFAKEVPQNCPKCNSIQLRTVGFGTEKIEEELSIFFPDINIRRMDLDTTKTRASYERIISEFEDGEVDVLIGTQMVSKGLDFNNVGLVGVLDADGMISFPDFRAHERAFQLMTQVAGRAGRFGERGKVVIQSSNPYHFVIQKVMEGNFEDFSKLHLRERKRFFYPPYSRLIKISIKHKDKTQVEQFANILASALRVVFKDNLVGPEFPLVSRIRLKYIQNILIKCPTSKELHNYKKRIVEIKERTINEQKFPLNGVVIDVDPY